MTAKELRDMLCDANSEAVVKVDDEDIISAFRVIDLSTSKDTVRLYTYARSND